MPGPRPHEGVRRESAGGRGSAQARPGGRTRAASGARQAAPTEFTYTRTQSRSYVSGDGPFRYQEQSDTERWVRADGVVRTRSRITEVSFPTERDREAWRQEGSPSLTSGWVDENGTGGATATRFAAIDLTSEVLTRESEDPEQVAKQLQQAGADYGDNPDINDRTFSLVADLVTDPTLAASARAAVFRAASYLPGVSLADKWTDPLGRRGSAIARTASVDAIRTELILETQTGELLGRREVVARPTRDFADVPVGTVLGWHSTIKSGVTPDSATRP